MSFKSPGLKSVSMKTHASKTNTGVISMSTTSKLTMNGMSSFGPSKMPKLTKVSVPSIQSQSKFG